MNDRAEWDLDKGIELAALHEGQLVSGCFRGQPVILTRYRGQYCALSGKCTHLDGPLGEGMVVDGEVRCPWHHARFSVLTGNATSAPAFAPIKRFGTIVREGRLFLNEVAEPLDPEYGPPSSRRVVIVGSGAAGYACAELLRRSNFSNQLILISNDPDPPYDRTFCSKQYLIGLKSREETIQAVPDPGFTHVRGHLVRTVDAQQKFVLLDDGKQVSFDFLVLATGGEPKRADWPGADLPNVHVLRSLQDTDAIIEQAKQSKEVAVIGSSFIGLETAASLQQRKMRVQVVTPEKVPLEKLLGSDIGRMIQTVHEEKGVVFNFGRKVRSYDGKRLTLDDGSVRPADFVVLGIGVTPRTQLAEAAGLRCAPPEAGGGIIVDERLETSIPGIFAAGDVARYPDPHSGKDIRVEHWVHAQRQGQHVARVIMGQATRYSDIPFFWSAHFDTGLRYVGHVGSTENESTTGTVEGRNFSRLMQGAGHEKAFLTCNRDLESLSKEAEWDPGPLRA